MKSIAKTNAVETGDNEAYQESELLRPGYLAQGI